MDDLDNRLQRIQAVFFPDLFDDDILTKSRVNEHEETCVEMLATPAFELRDVLRELVYYSDDAQVTAAAMSTAAMSPVSLSRFLISWFIG